MPTSSSFWDSIGPGLVNTGLGVLRKRYDKKDQDERQRRAQGPLYDQQIGLAGTALNRAASLDPQAVAQERFNAQQALLAEGDRGAEEALMRRLVAQGQSGIASYGGQAGAQQTPGQPINPQLAALYAAREARNAQSAFDSLNEGEAQIDRQVQRANTLSGQAENTRATRLPTTPSRPSTTSQILSGAAKLLQQPNAIPGLFSAVGDIWGSLKGAFGGNNWLNDDQWFSDYTTIDDYDIF